MIDVTSKRRTKATLKLDLLKAFGADFTLNIRDSLFFANESARAIIYPVGHHIAIRDIFSKEEMRKNDIMFIYNDNDVIKLTSMNMSRDYSLLLVCDKKEHCASISIYNLSKLTFNSITIFKPKRKVITTIYKKFIYAAFSVDGNYIASLGQMVSESGEKVLHGIIWDVQIFQSYKEDNYKPKCLFVLPAGVNKITIENKIICTSGENHLSFWYIYENTVKEFKSIIKGLDLNRNFVDHDWLVMKIPTLVSVTAERDLYIFEGYNESNSKSIIKKANDNDDEFGMNMRVEKFILKHHITNCFNNDTIVPCILKAFNKGIVIGSTQGHLLFVEKKKLTDTTFVPIRYTKREKPAKVTGITFCSGEDYMAVSYNSNEIASISLKNIFESLKNINFDLKMNLVCDGFHQGPITSMDVALQRPVIVTTSKVDKTVRVWNFLTGHCEYCKIILTEKEKSQEKEMDILSVAIHPNGYYLAISDKEMIRFFHLCYKELRFYNTDTRQNETPKSECHLLKFSFGGHLLAAASRKVLYLIRSYTRETLKAFDTPHTGEITNIIFHEQDYYVYSIGTDGLIVQYNLFSFKIDKLYTKYINYSGGSFSSLSKYQTCIAACGMQGTNLSSITEVICSDSPDNFELNGEGPNTEAFVTLVDKNLTALSTIKSKRFDIHSIAAGSDDGYLGLYPLLLCQGMKKDETGMPWKRVKSHKGKITSIAYSLDTNLLFSAGEDGNLFIYCIHELPDGENLSFEDNTTNINQITAILDEGLGDNVLYPLNSISGHEEEVQNKNNLIDEYKNQEEKLKAEHTNKLRERELELNKKRESEIKELSERLADIKQKQEDTIENYKEKIKLLENDHRQMLIEKEKNYTERIDQMSNTIHDLNSKIYSLKSEHELDLKKKDEGYEKKFHEIDIELRNKFEEIKSNNDKLTNELQLRQKLEEYKFIHLDQEHEQEINYKNEKFESIITKMEKERLINQGEISTLLDEKKKTNAKLNELQNEIKKKNDEIKRHLDTIRSLRESNELKEYEKEELKKKLKINEGDLQEKSKIAGFSNKLKNELYIKNKEISSHYNKQQIENTELKDTRTNILKELEENVKILENREKEIRKHQLLLEEYKEKYERERQNALLKEKDFDNLLQKIYDTFQSNDKNIIINGIRKIYNIYLTGDVTKKIDSSKLNVNIRDELTKQIDFLQKGILSVTNTKKKRENNQNSEIFKKTRENTDLIKQLNEKKKAYCQLEKDHNTLKSKCGVHQKTCKKFDEELRGINISVGNANTGDDYNLPKLKKGDDNVDELANALYKNKDDANNETQKKSWKDTKLYKGNSLSLSKNIRNDAYKIGEIKKILDEKNEVIRRQRIEIEMLQNNIIPKKDNMNYTSYNANPYKNMYGKEQITNNSHLGSLSKKEQFKESSIENEQEQDPDPDQE